MRIWKWKWKWKWKLEQRKEVSTDKPSSHPSLGPTAPAVEERGREGRCHYERRDDPSCWLLGLLFAYCIALKQYGTCTEYVHSVQCLLHSINTVGTVHVVVLYESIMHVR
jgi:hypothetical protein